MSTTTSRTGEWNAFAALCEFMRIVCFNKLNFKGDEKEQFAECFTRIKSNEERVKFVLQNDDLTSVLLLVVQSFSSKRKQTSKDPGKAKRKREEGEDCFKSKNFAAAAQCFTEVILNAPHSTESAGNASELTSAYGKRAEAYFQLNRYGDCLLDVEEAITCGNLFQMREDLLQMKAVSLIEMSKRDERLQKNSRGLSSGSALQEGDYSEVVSQIYTKRKVVGNNEVLESGSDFIQLNTSPEKGRYLTTRKEIVPNEVLLVETPFVSWLKPSLYSTHCNHCIKSVEWVFVPCKACNRVKYCTRQCRDNAWSQYHGVECNLLDLLEPLSKGHLAVRIMLRANICSAVEMFESDQQNAGALSRVKHSVYQSILSLVDNSNDFDFATLFKNTLGAVLITLLLRQHNVLAEVNADNDYRVACLLLFHINQIHCNGIQIMEQKIVDVSYDGEGNVTYKITQNKESLGLGLYHNLSLLNHSCYNTTKSLFNGSQITFTSACQLNARDELTFNYGPHYKVNNKKQRHDFLLKFYFFECDCKACQEDWSVSQ